MAVFIFKFPIEWCDFVIVSPLHIDDPIYTYSQTCIKRSPFGTNKSCSFRQVTSQKRFNLFEIFYDRTRIR